MRAGPLSDAKVIALLNRAFVCVYTVNEDYVGKNASAPADFAGWSAAAPSGSAPSDTPSAAACKKSRRL